VMDDPDLARQFATYWQTPQADALTRMKLFKLAWDMVGSEFAGRHLQYEKFYAGASFIIRNHSYRETDWDEFNKLVEELMASYDYAVERQTPDAGLSVLRRQSSARCPSRPSVERIAAVLEALEPALLVELVEVAQDLAAVAGAERGHEFEIGRGAFGQRSFEGLPRTSRHLRWMRHRELGAGALAERPGAVEAALGAGAAPLQRRIERDATEARRHDEVAVGLEARGQRPVDLLVGKDVDVVVDHEHMLDVAGGAEHRGDGVARLAGIALTQRDAHVVHAAGGCGAANRYRLANGMLQHAPDRGLGLGGAELRRVGEGEPRAADGHGLEQRIAPFGNGGEMEYRIAFEQAVIADVFAVRPLGFDQPALVDIAFEHEFGVGRNADIDGDAFHDRHRRAAHRTDHVELVHRC